MGFQNRCALFADAAAADNRSGSLLRKAIFVRRKKKITVRTAGLVGFLGGCNTTVFHSEERLCTCSAMGECKPKNDAN